jgi:hypothetical protein
MANALGPLRKSSKREGAIVPSWVFEARLERRRKYNDLDEQHKRFWLREQEILADFHPSLQKELDAVRQAMTDIEHQMHSLDEEF